MKSIKVPQKVFCSVAVSLEEKDSTTAFTAKKN